MSGNLWSQILTVSSDGFLLSMKYNVFVFLSLFNKMSDLGLVVNKSVPVRVLANHRRGQWGARRFLVARKFSTGKTKGFDIFII